MSRILGLLNPENYEMENLEEDRVMEIYAENKEELVQGWKDYFKTYWDEDKVEELTQEDKIDWDGEGFYVYAGRSFDCGGIGLTEFFEHAEIKNVSFKNEDGSLSLDYLYYDNNEVEEALELYYKKNGIKYSENEE